MSGGHPIPRNRAMSVAKQFTEQIQDCVETAVIAGSFRRGKEFVHDVEIVAKPKFSTKQADLFGGNADLTPDKNSRNELHERLLQMRNSGIVTTDRYRKDRKQNPFGQKYYRINYHPSDTDYIYPIDLFVVIPPAQWGVILLLRTGSASFSHWFVQQGRAYGIKVDQGHLEMQNMVLDTPTEEDVFNYMHVPYISPTERDDVP